MQDVLVCCIYRSIFDALSHTNRSTSRSSTSTTRLTRASASSRVSYLHGKNEVTAAVNLSLMQEKKAVHSLEKKIVHLLVFSKKQRERSWHVKSPRKPCRAGHPLHDGSPLLQWRTSRSFQARKSPARQAHTSRPFQTPQSPARQTHKSLARQAHNICHSTLLVSSIYVNNTRFTSLRRL